MKITKEELLDRGFVRFSEKLYSYPADAKIEIWGFVEDDKTTISIVTDQQLQSRDGCEIVVSNCNSIEDVDKIIKLFIA